MAQQSTTAPDTIPAQETAATNLLFPVFLKLEQLELLLVGGGNVGLEKLRALLGNSPAAKITIVAPRILPELRELAKQSPACRIVERNFTETDLDGKQIAILATDDPALHQWIRQLAEERRLLINVADTPDLCDFYLGSVVQKGQLKIGISTNGQSPTLAKRLKEVLQESIPEETDTLIGNLHKIRNRLKGDFSEKVKELNQLTRILAETENQRSERKWKRIATLSITAFALMLIGHFIFSYIPFREIGTSAIDWARSLDKNFPWMMLAGFLAQMIDGATSMGYGVTSTMVLMSANVSPAAISGSVHTAEMFASGASGYSHYKFGNVNKKMFKALLIPGIIGAILGAVLLVKFGESHITYIRPILAAYTFVLGIKIFINAFKSTTARKKFRHYGWLAGFGGFLDSFGGGGWGPIVSATLITKGRTPRYVVGSVSLTEFFVTLASAFTFFTMIGVQHWQVILALIIGSVTAAPLAARLNGKLPRKASFILLGTIVVLWSLRILLKAIL